MQLRLAAAALVVAFAAAEASAHGLTPALEDVEAAVRDAEPSYESDPRGLRAILQMRRILGRPSAGRSLAREIGAVAAAARILETRIGTESPLSGSFALASQRYAAVLQECRANAGLASDAPGVSRGRRRRAARAVQRLDAALALPPLAAGKVATPATDLLRAYAGAARAAAGLTPFDGTAQYDWVVAEFDLSPAGSGIDLDGDRKPDNALATAQSLLVLAGIDVDVAQTVRDTLGAGGTFLLLELWGTRDLTRPDPYAFLGLLNAEDGDANPDNDYSGDGVFAPVLGSLGPDGHPVARAATALSRNGHFTVTLEGDGLPSGTFTLPAGSRLVIQGSATQAELNGAVGVVLPLAAVEQLLDDAGVVIPDAQKALLGLLADIDTDGDRQPDAISGSFTFRAVGAKLPALQAN